ncbi:Hypothetical predicted protein [Pelobates cultripes]|uniref:L1 transposable element RRM domain-containing protein n=1 Tax=Pelobates cultripes TaxID=61616 RepID=A0AAD1WL31_PELCU|nr:Hypothetical predicted protein [Pelobates cultripes]
MGRTRRLADPGGTPRPAGHGGDQSIRAFLHAAGRDQSPRREMEAASLQPESFPSTPAVFSPAPSPTPDSQQPQGGEWRDILPNLLTKADFEALSDRLGRVVREEVAQLRADVANVEARMAVAETETRALRTDLELTNVTVTKQDADLAFLTTWVDDLDNRGRRMNLRVRGVREGGHSENVPEILRLIFAQVLGGQHAPRIGLIRAHRALRPIPTPRRMGSIRMEGQTVSIYQDLSRYTLMARKALRPVTSALQQANIPYRWGYPFSLTARHGQDQLTIRKPDDVQSFLHALGLPPQQVPDWLARSFLQQPPGPQQRQPRGPIADQQRPRPQHQREWHQGQAQREQ